MDIVVSGSALLLRDPNRTKFHLWFVLTDPEGVDGLMVAVMVCTMKVFADETVVLEPGDHPFIKHRSCVAYSSAKYVKRSRIEVALRDRHCFLKESMAEELKAAAERDGDPGLIDKIADERVATTVEELLLFKIILKMLNTVDGGNKR